MKDLKLNEDLVHRIGQAQTDLENVLPDIKSVQPSGRPDELVGALMQVGDARQLAEDGLTRATVKALKSIGADEDFATQVLLALVKVCPELAKRAEEVADFGEAMSAMPHSKPTETRSINPATGEELGKVPLHNLEDLKQAVEKSREAHKEWAAIPVKKRIKALYKIRDYIVEHADELADTISKDNGKTRTDALVTEVLPAAVAATYWARMAPKFLKDERLKPGFKLLANKSSKLTRVPLGVIGVISPWNYPFSIAFSEVLMGLAAGNGVVLKTATETQMVGGALEKCIQAGDLPEGLFSFLNLPGQVAGSGMLESGIDKLFFTGSVPVGKKLMAKAAETLTPVSLELGGNDAMLVCEDADLERAATGAMWGGMQNAGQSCGGVERVYVHADVYDEFIEKLGEKVRALRVGPDVDWNVDIGAMTTQKQADLVQAHIDDALKGGAKILVQADVPKDSKGIFMPPTVLTNVNHDMDVMREETFGPVLGVMKVESMEEAVRLANDSDLGLTASIWSRKHKKAKGLAKQIEAGVVMLNDHLMSHGMPETPWGGFKNSGIGRTHGEPGFDEMTELKTIVDDWLPGVKKDMWWHPHGEGDVYRGVLGMLHMLWGDGVGQRLGGMARLLKLYVRTFKMDG